MSHSGGELIMEYYITFTANVPVISVDGVPALTSVPQTGSVRGPRLRGTTQFPSLLVSWWQQA